MKAVEVESLWWRYASSNRWVLREVNLEVEEGEIVGILGPSGAGKTTLCLSLSGIIPHGIRGELRGSVKIFGVDTSSSSIKELARHLGVVFQDPDTQFVTMRVLDEVAFPLENFGIERSEMLRRVKEALEYTRMWELRDRYPFELSGGQKQRVAIASMLARRPRLLILDEPTSDLDPVGKREVFEVLARLRDEHGITMIIVEHNTEDLVKYADRLVVLKDGEVIAEGDPRSVFSKAEQLERLGVHVPQGSKLALKISRKLGELNGYVPLTLEESAKYLSKFRSYLRVNRRESLLVGGKPVIEFRDVSFVYEDGTLAVKNVNLEVLEGDFLAIIGPNGSGKTTIAKLMTALYKPTRGVVEIFGEDSRDLSASDVALRVGYVYQNPDHQLFCNTVYEEVAFALRNMGLDEGEVRQRVEEMLGFVGLSGFEDVPPYFLSKGERQRLAIAAVLAMGPQVIIVDEPTTGQDEQQSRIIMELLARMNRAGRTVVVITHDMKLVAEYARSVALVRDGEVLAVGPTRKVLADLELMGRAGLEPPQVVRLSQMVLGEPALTVEEVEVYG